MENYYFIFLFIFSYAGWERHCFACCCAPVFLAFVQRKLCLGWRENSPDGVRSCFSRFSYNVNKCLVWRENSPDGVRSCFSRFCTT